MRLARKIVCFFIVCYSVCSFGQKIEEHQWKQRVLIILTHNEHNNEYKKQLSVFEGEALHFKERKLIVYHTMPKSYKKGLPASTKHISATLYTTYKKTKNAFEIVLIGLDGGIKLRKTSLLTKLELYGLIDSMPMRKNEIKNKG